MSNDGNNVLACSFTLRAWFVRDDALSECRGPSLSSVVGFASHRIIDDTSLNQVLIFRSNGTSYHRSVLSFANHSLEIVKLLVAAGADVNERNACGGGIPLHDAAPDVAEFLVENGADVNKLGDGDGVPLLYAAYMGEAENVELLLKHGADITSASPAGLSPLHCVGFYLPRLKGFRSDEGFDPQPFRRILRALLNAGCDVTLQCKNDVATDAGPHVLHAETALHFAAAGGDSEIVRMLLDSGADPQAKNSLGETPSDWSRKFYGNEEVEGLLGQTMD